MLKRKNVGSLLIGISIALGLFALAAAIVWWQQGMNILIGSLVFILYGIGQWMTVLYWQRIQSDWETTGEVLGRLQQAVSDIPAALDSNLKSIATRLTEGQAQALAKLQGEVNEGARTTLEKGAQQIGDSLAKNLTAPLDSLKTLVEGFARQNEAQGERLTQLAGTMGDSARQSVAQGAELIAASLDKNLKQPLAALEAKLIAWAQHAQAQSDAARSVGDEMLKAQREGGERAQRLAEGLTQEFKSLAGTQSAQAERLLAAWAERAAASQTEAESRLAALRDALVADVTSKLREAQASQAEAQERVLAQALAGVEAQARSAQEAVAGQVKALQAAAAEQSQALRAAASEQTKALQAATTGQTQALQTATAEQINSLQSAFAEQAKSGQAASDTQVKALHSAVESFVDGLGELKETSLRLVTEVEAKASASLEAQSQLGLEVAGKVSDLADRMRQGSQEVAELAHVAQINQTEMQAGVAMLNSGLSSILDRLERQASAGDGYQSLLAELGKTLADFQERSAEVLIENALKTQEILMEVLRHQEGRTGAENALAAA